MADFIGLNGHIPKEADFTACLTALDRSGDGISFLLTPNSYFLSSA